MAGHAKWINFSEGKGQVKVCIQFTPTASVSPDKSTNTLFGKLDDVSCCHLQEEDETTRRTSIVTSLLAASPMEGFDDDDDIDDDDVETFASTTDLSRGASPADLISVDSKSINPHRVRTSLFMNTADSNCSLLAFSDVVKETNPSAAALRVWKRAS
jgi:hypothetical protein